VKKELNLEKSTTSNDTNAKIAVICTLLSSGRTKSLQKWRKKQSTSTLRAWAWPDVRYRGNIHSQTIASQHDWLVHKEDAFSLTYLRSYW